MSSIWEALNEDGKNWRVILKVRKESYDGPPMERATVSTISSSSYTYVCVQALSLLEHLVKLGSERVVDDARTNMFRIRMYNDFTYRDDMGHDRGGGSKCDY